MQRELRRGLRLGGGAALAFALGCSTGGATDGGTGASDDGSSSATGNPVECASEPTHSGDGTYYAADGSGNCSFDPSSDLNVGAMNHTDYAASAVCGECVKVDGPLGSLVVRIVDQCPECQPGDIDLSAEAFAKIAKPEDGRVDISWKVVSCGYDQPIQYHHKDGTNPYWSAIQIRRANNPIAKVEAKVGGAYQAGVRADYNFFIFDQGLGDGPYALRVTDIYGNVVEDAAVPFAENTTFDGAAQFPPCAP